MIEKEGIENLSSYSSKNNGSVVLSDSEVAFLGTGRDAAFRPFLWVYFVYTLRCVIEDDCRFIYIYIYMEVKLATDVEGDPKAPI